MNYKNIVFDLGGVLIEWNPLEVLQRLQFPLYFSEVFDSLLWGAHDGGWLSRNEVIDKLPPRYDKETFKYCVQALSSQLRPIPEMIELLHEVRLKGYKIYLLSNMPKELHEELHAIHDFLQYFEGQFYSYKVGAIKPQPQIYDMFLKHYQIKGSESIFIDDREENVNAAKKFEIDSILHQNPVQTREELKMRKIISPDALTLCE